MAGRPNQQIALVAALQYGPRSLSDLAKILKCRREALVSAAQAANRKLTPASGLKIMCRREAFYALEDVSCSK